MNGNRPSEFEKSSLEAHVEGNKIRFSHIDESFKALTARLDHLDQKVEELHEDFKNSNTQLIKAIIAAAGTVTAGLISTIVVMIVKI